MRQREMSARIGSRITEIAVGAQLQFTGRRLILAGRDDGPRPLARHIVVDFVGSFARQFGKSEARRSACGSRFGALHAVDPYPVVGAPQKRNRRAVDGARRRSRGRTGHTGQFDSAAAPNRPCFLFELRGTGRQQQSSTKKVNNVSYRMQFGNTGNAGARFPAPTSLPQRVDFRRIYFHVPVGSTS